LCASEITTSNETKPSPVETATPTQSAVSPKSTTPVTYPKSPQPPTYPIPTQPQTYPIPTQPVTYPTRSLPLTYSTSSQKPVTSPTQTEPVTYPKSSQPITYPIPTQPNTHPTQTQPVIYPIPTQAETYPTAQFVTTTPFGYVTPSMCFKFFLYFFSSEVLIIYRITRDFCNHVTQWKHSTLCLQIVGRQRRQVKCVGSGCSSWRVEIGGLSGLEISLYSISANIRLSACSTPWAGPCSTSTLSLQTLRGPTSTGADREGKFPSLGSPVADDNRPTNASLTGPVFPSVTSRGGELVARFWDLERVCILPRRYLTG